MKLNFILTIISTFLIACLQFSVSSPIGNNLKEQPWQELAQILNSHNIDIGDNEIAELYPILESELNVKSPNTEKESDNINIRRKRATCDVLSFQSKWLSVNHSACAIHCISKKKKGGRCVNSICVCRN